MCSILLQSLLESIEKGGPGSGNFGHKGTPGSRGGSAPSGGVPIISGKPKSIPHSLEGEIEPAMLRWAGGVDGFIDNGKTYRVFHGTDESKVAGILEKGLVPPERVGSKWYMVTTDFDVARSFATFNNPVVIEYRIPSNKLKQVLWKGDHTGYGDVQAGIRKKLEGEFAQIVYRTTYKPWSG